MKILSLFDGISAGHVALERAGIQIESYHASEIDKYAITISEKNYPDIIRLGDITKWKEWDIEKPDLIMGGFPCQPYSVAGKRKGLEDSRGGNLVDAMMGIIEKYKPENILLENVKGLLSIDDGNTFKNILKTLNNIGYAVDWIVINSALVSAQNRERIFIVGKRLDKCNSYKINIDKYNKRNSDITMFDIDTIIVFDSEIIQPKDKGILLKDIIETGENKIKGGRITGRNPDNPKSRQAGLPTVQMLELREDDKTNCLSTVCKDSVVCAIKDHDEYKLKNDKAQCLDANYFKGIDNHGQRTAVGCIQVGEANINGNDSIKRIYSQEGKSPTLTVICGGNQEPKIADNNITWRKLTPIECERLQTFPDNFTKGVSNSRRYHALGNSWTVDVIAHIFLFIKK